MTDFDEKELLRKYREGICNQQELQWLENWYADLHTKDRVTVSKKDLERVGSLMRENVMSRIQLTTVKMWRRNAIAAAVAATILTIGLYFYYNSYNTKGDEEKILASIDIAPGRNKASVTLANGTIIPLSGAKSGLMVNAGTLMYSDGTELDRISKDDNQKSGRNLVETPRGGTYQLVLDDGTKVWLNAASSLNFPASFTNREVREVILTGEAYFQVSKDNKRPFIVHTDLQDVEVLGTHFNINSYPDEGRTITTLEEGSVKVSSIRLNLTHLIKPGEQSILEKNKLDVEPADLKTALGWKNGLLEFKDADIRTIMREVSRWYDIDIEYEGNVSDRRFVASLPRQSNLSTLIKLLKLSDINFKLKEGAQRKILVVFPSE